MLGELAVAVGGAPGIFDAASKHCCVYIYVLAVDQCSVSKKCQLVILGQVTKLG